MRATLYEKRKRNPASIATSLVAHVIFIALIASITFRYPLSAFFNRDTLVPTERLRYVVMEPRLVQAAGNGADEKAKPKKAEKPAPLIAPSMVPTTLPPAAPPTPTAGSISGTGTGSGGSPVGVATGIEPSLPDSRIELKPNTLRLPISQSARNDSAVKAIIMEFRAAEIAAEETRGRSPKDWTMERNGQKYGLDSQYIYLGRFKLPSAILAAIPFKTGGVDGAALTRQRNADWIRNDIASHAQGMSQDDFNAAIKRIRDRKDRDKKAQDDEKKAAARITPIVP